MMLAAMDNNKRYKQPVGAKVDPPIKAAIEVVAERKGQTVSRFIERLILKDPAVKAELEKASVRAAVATS